MTFKSATLEKDNAAYLAARDFYYDNIYPAPGYTFHRWLLKQERARADYGERTISFKQEADKIMFLLKWGS